MPIDSTQLPLTRAAWKNRRVLILGLGQYPKGSGVAAALLFARLGARVTVTDLKTKKELRANAARLRRFHNVRFVLGKHDLRDVRTAELIVANQRVRRDSRELRLARRLGIPAVTEIALFFDRCPSTVIGVTGTRGKSTTSALITAMLKASGLRVWLGGNILASPLTFLRRIKRNDVCVLELSSFQTESLADRAPHIAVVTNLLRDHLNTYDGMEDYAEAKAQIFRHQTARDVLVLNGDDAYGRRWSKEAPSRVVVFGWSRGQARVQERNLVLIEKGRKMRVARLVELPLIGRHNVMNILAACLAARAAGASMDGIRRGLFAFKPLPHRLEHVRTIHGVSYVNDTCATTPDGTIAAIEALSRGHRHLWLIAGGADKELEYDELAKAVKRHRPHIHVLLLPGDASVKINRALVSVSAHVHPVKDLAEAVALASKRAVRGDVVVLSPGAASFNQFANEFERGEAFRRAAQRLR